MGHIYKDPGVPQIQSLTFKFKLVVQTRNTSINIVVVHHTTFNYAKTKASNLLMSPDRVFLTEITFVITKNRTHISFQEREDTNPLQLLCASIISCSTLSEAGSLLNPATVFLLNYITSLATSLRESLATGSVTYGKTSAGGSNIEP